MSVHCFFNSVICVSLNKILYYCMQGAVIQRCMQVLFVWHACRGCVCGMQRAGVACAACSVQGLRVRNAACKGCSCGMQLAPMHPCTPHRHSSTQNNDQWELSIAGLVIIFLHIFILKSLLIYVILLCCFFISW